MKEEELIGRMDEALENFRGRAVDRYTIMCAVALERQINILQVLLQKVYEGELKVTFNGGKKGSMIDVDNYKFGLNKVGVTTMKPNRPITRRCWLCSSDGRDEAHEASQDSR
jgi:hypothetical protein